MEILFNVPPDLKRRLEYIPKGMLQNILADVFRRGFEVIDKQALDETEIKSVHTSDIDINAILEAVRSIQPQAEQKSSFRQEVEKDEPIGVSIVSKIDIPTDVDLDEDLLGMLK